MGIWGIGGRLCRIFIVELRGGVDYLRIHTCTNIDGILEDGVLGRDLVSLVLLPVVIITRY